MTTEASTPPDVAPQPPGATLHLGGDAWAHPSLDGRDLVPIDTITPYPGNPRRGDQDAITSSIRDLGLYAGVVVQRATGHILVGNHRRHALVALGAERIPVTYVDVDDTRAAAIVARDNRTSDLGGYDDAELLALLTEDPDVLALSGYDDDDTAALMRALSTDYVPPSDTPSLSDRFVVPPFTVLDQRSGAWQDRKRRWLSLGIASEVGRGETAAEGVSGVGPTGERWRENPDQYRQVEGRRKTLGAVQTNLDGEDAARYGRKDTRARSVKGQEGLTKIKPNLAGALAGDQPAVPQVSSPYSKGAPRKDEVSAKIAGTSARTLGQGLQAHRDPETGELTYTETTAAGVSIFDPVLTELSYRWFSPPGGVVLDPFAGGSVRGIVAAALGRPYIGVELRGEQVAANGDQRDLILPRLPAGSPDPVWHTGDSLQVLPTLDVQADLLFSCPPYADLEVYSDDPADLSNMPYDDFLTAYRGIIAAGLDRLRADRFAVWVIGEVRDRRGLYRGLVPDTIRAFTDAGAALYNEAVLVTPVGSLPIRAGRQFASGRKLGKTHQTVLTFVKGDPKAAAEACGTVEVTLPDFGEGDDGD